MKKLLIGCAVVIVLVVSLLVGVSIYAVVKIQSIGQGFAASTDRIQQLETRFPFQASPERRLDAKRVDQYFVIRQAMRTKAESNRTIQKLIEQNQPANIGPVEVFRFVFGFPQEFMETFSLQLEANNMSATEYAFIASTVIETARQGAAAGDPVMQGIIDSITNTTAQINMQLSQNPQASQLAVDIEESLDSRRMAEDVLAANIALVRRYADELVDTPALTFLEFLLLQADFVRTNPAIEPPPAQ